MVVSSQPWTEPGAHAVVPGVFRIPLGTVGVTVLASLPLAVLGLVVVLSFQDGQYGLPAIIGAAVAIGLGPIMYRIARRGPGMPATH